MGELRKVLSDIYVSERETIQENDALRQVADSEFVIRQILSDKKEDAALNSAKEIVKDLNGGYSSAIKHEKAKIEFLLEKIEEARILKTMKKDEE